MSLGILDMVCMNFGLTGPNSVKCYPEVLLGQLTHTWTFIVLVDMVMIYGEQCSVKSSGREPAGRWSINLCRDGCTASGRGSPPGTKPVHFHYENFRTGRLEWLCTLILHDVVPSQFDTCIRYVLTWTCFMPGCL